MITLGSSLTGQQNVPGSIGLVALLAVTMSAAAAAGGESVDVRRDVAPILEQHCLRCHQPGNAKGGISLVKADDLLEHEHVVPGRPDESDLLDLVQPASATQRPEMPKKGEPLSPGQVEVLRRWIAEGARWPEDLVLQEKSRADTSWWSLRPLADAAPPAAPHDAWARNPIDRFVLAKLQERGLRPAPPADRRTLIRRLTYDLTGLPPAPEEVEAFVADRSPVAYEAVVDRLLASPHYGERWGRHWLDVARFAESTGYENNKAVDNAWPFRDAERTRAGAARPAGAVKNYRKIARSSMDGPKKADHNGAILSSDHVELTRFAASSARRAVGAGPWRGGVRTRSAPTGSGPGMAFQGDVRCAHHDPRPDSR